MVLEAELLARQADLRRIVLHELFHFVWLRAGNGRRWSFEQVIQSELDRGARGELGWSAQWRKEALRGRDRASRSPRWREYVCESFCDTAGWLLAEVARHGEFTLAERFRQRRREWFQEFLAGPGISI